VGREKERRTTLPLYEVKCNECKKEFDAFAKIANRQQIKCDCGGNTTILISSSHHERRYPFWNEHLDPDKSILVKSKEHYRQLCKQYKVYAPHEFGQGYNISEI